MWQPEQKPSLKNGRSVILPRAKLSAPHGRTVLRNPIVWTKNLPIEEPRLPFDIQSHNILQWESENLGIFEETLRHRIVAALDKAGSTSRR